MKLFLIVSGLILVPAFIMGQGRWKEAGDQWYNEHIDAGLKVGDRMPDIALGTVINNYTGKTNLSAFKGKIVILDFWSTGCSICIQSFPKMEDLQKLFGDEIQIFIVNPWEDQAQIEKRFSKNKKLPNLPSIIGTGAKALEKLFPLRGVPNHIWIDKDGFICMRGSGLNTSEEKIREELEGKKIDFLKDANTTPRFNKNIPYSLLMNHKLISTEFFFTEYNGEYTPDDGYRAEGIIDTSSGTIRDTYVNTEVVDFYEKIYGKEIGKKWDNIINVFNLPYLTSGNLWLDHFIFEVKDTLRYTSRFIPYLKRTDRQFVKSRFCYEQVHSLGVAPDLRMKTMEKNLNQCFDSLYKATIRLEKRSLDCYSLVKIADRITDAELAGEISVDTFIVNGRKQIKYSNDWLSSIISSTILNSSLKSMFRNPITSQPVFIVNNTGIDRITIMLPSVINNMDELKEALRRYGLDILPVQKEFEFIVIRDY